jgi:hypothetical protein
LLTGQGYFTDSPKTLISLDIYAVESSCVVVPETHNICEGAMNFRSNAKVTVGEQKIMMIREIKIIHPSL